MPRRFRTRLDTPRSVALLALLLVALFAGARLVGNGGHPSAFVVAGDHFVDPATAPDELVVAQDSFGYDGQFVYRLALDPLTREETAYGITLDNPPYRQQRIGLAALTWAVTAATPLPLSATLILVNGLALAGAAWLGAIFARRHGRHPLWGLVAGLSPGVVIAFARDLTEPLAWVLLLAGLLLWTDRRDGWAAVAFTAAVLCRETTLAVLAGLGVWLLLSAARSRSAAPARRALLLLVPLAVALGWQWHLYQVWGEVPVATGGGHPGTRFVGIAGHLFEGLGEFATVRDGVLRHVWIVERLWLAGLYAAVVLSLRRTAAPRPVRAGWVCGALLGLSVTAWARDVQFLRAANEAIAVGVLVLLATRSRLADRALLSTGGVSLAVAAVHSVL